MQTLNVDIAVQPVAAKAPVSTRARALPCVSERAQTATQAAAGWQR